MAPSRRVLVWPPRRPGTSCSPTGRRSAARPGRRPPATCRGTPTRSRSARRPRAAARPALYRPPLSRRAPLPGVMLEDAALLTSVSQPELLAERNVLAERHEPRLHVGALDPGGADQHRPLLVPLSRRRGVLADQDLGAVPSPTAPRSPSATHRSACVAPVRSSAIPELSPQTIRSGCTPLSLPPALNWRQRLARVGARHRVGDQARLDERDRAPSARRDGEVSARASGPAPATSAKATAPGRRGRAGGLNAGPPWRMAWPVRGQPSGCRAPRRRRATQPGRTAPRIPRARR